MRAPSVRNTPVVFRCRARAVKGNTVDYTALGDGQMGRAKDERVTEISLLQSRSRERAMRESVRSCRRLVTHRGPG